MIEVFIGYLIIALSILIFTVYINKYMNKIKKEIDNERETQKELNIRFEEEMFNVKEYLQSHDLNEDKDPEYKKFNYFS